MYMHKCQTERGNAIYTKNHIIIYQHKIKIKIKFTRTLLLRELGGSGTLTYVIYLQPLLSLAMCFQNK